MAFELPQFQSTLKGVTPSTPNLSFNPGANPDTGPAQVALERQRLQMQSNQQSQQNVLQTIKMASDLAQSFVEASKQRQQKDAVAAYAAMQPNKALAPVMRAFPNDTANMLLHPVTNLQGLATSQLQQTGQVNPNVIQTQQAMQKPITPKLTTLQKPDGLHQVLVDSKGNQTDLGLGKQPLPPIGKIFQGTESDGTVHNKRLENDGTITDLGIAKPDVSKAKVSAQAQSTADFAKTMIPHVDEMRQIVHEAAQQGYIGPSSGRIYGQFLAGKVGSTGDPKADQLLGKLRAVDTLIKSGTLKVHFGSRGGQQMYQHFSDVLNSGKQSEAEINGALDGIKSFLDGYANIGQNQPINAHGINIDTNALDAEMKKRGL